MSLVGSAVSSGSSRPRRRTLPAAAAGVAMAERAAGGQSSSGTGTGTGTGTSVHKTPLSGGIESLPASASASTRMQPTAEAAIGMPPLIDVVPYRKTELIDRPLARRRVSAGVRGLAGVGEKTLPPEPKTQVTFSMPPRRSSPPPVTPAAPSLDSALGSAQARQMHPVDQGEYAPAIGRYSFRDRAWRQVSLRTSSYAALMASFSSRRAYKKPTLVEEKLAPSIVSATAVYETTAPEGTRASDDSPAARSVEVDVERKDQSASERSRSDRQSSTTRRRKPVVLEDAHVAGSADSSARTDRAPALAGPAQGVAAPGKPRRMSPTRPISAQQSALLSPSSAERGGKHATPASRTPGPRPLAAHAPTRSGSPRLPAKSDMRRPRNRRHTRDDSDGAESDQGRDDRLAPSSAARNKGHEQIASPAAGTSSTQRSPGMPADLATYPAFRQRSTPDVQVPEAREADDGAGEVSASRGVGEVGSITQPYLKTTQSKRQPDQQPATRQDEDDRPEGDLIPLSPRLEVIQEADDSAEIQSAGVRSDAANRSGRSSGTARHSAPDYSKHHFVARRPSIVARLSRFFDSIPSIRTNFVAPSAPPSIIDGSVLATTINEDDSVSRLMERQAAAEQQGIPPPVAHLATSISREPLIGSARVVLDDTRGMAVQHAGYEGHAATDHVVPPAMPSPVKDWPLSDGNGHQSPVDGARSDPDSSYRRNKKPTPTHESSLWPVCEHLRIRIAKGGGLDIEQDKRVLFHARYEPGSADGTRPQIVLTAADGSKTPAFIVNTRFALGPSGVRPETLAHAVLLRGLAPIVFEKRRAQSIRQVPCFEVIPSALLARQEEQRELMRLRELQGQMSNKVRNVLQQEAWANKVNTSVFAVASTATPTASDPPSDQTPQGKCMPPPCLPSAKTANGNRKSLRPPLSRGDTSLVSATGGALMMNRAAYQRLESPQNLSPPLRNSPPLPISPPQQSLEPDAEHEAAKHELLATATEISSTIPYLQANLNAGLALPASNLHAVSSLDQQQQALGYSRVSPAATNHRASDGTSSGRLRPDDRDQRRDSAIYKSHDNGTFPTFAPAEGALDGKSKRRRLKHTSGDFVVRRDTLSPTAPGPDVAAACGGQLHASASAGAGAGAGAGEDDLSSFSPSHVPIDRLRLAWKRTSDAGFAGAKLVDLDDGEVLGYFIPRSAEARARRAPPSLAELEAADRSAAGGGGLCKPTAASAELAGATEKAQIKRRNGKLDQIWHARAIDHAALTGRPIAAFRGEVGRVVAEVKVQGTGSNACKLVLATALAMRLVPEL